MSDAANQEANDTSNGEGSGPSPETIERARRMGWRPKEEFRGDTSRWVDADTYVKRGEEFIPLIQAENRKLRDDLQAAKQKTDELAQTVSDAQEALEALKQYQSTATRAAVEKAKQDLREQIKAARRDDDVDAELAAQTSLRRVEEEEAKLKEAKEKKPEPAAKKEEPKIDPAFAAWQADNPWFGADKRRTALANGIAAELREDPKNDSLLGRAFFDRVSEEVDRVMGSRQGTKVDGGGNSGGSRPGGGEVKKTFDQLPADAKAACDSMTSKLVGSGRAFKDQAAWRAHYAKQYFEMEQ